MSSASAYEAPNELEFSFTEMLREIQELSRIAVDGNFLAPGGEALLDRFRRSLEQIQASAPLVGSLGGRMGTVYPWVISREEPLYTRPSTSYERGEREGGDEMCAEITAMWEVRPAPKPSKKMPSRTFCVAGKASVAVEWYSTLGGERVEPLGRWRMELADAKSPGCYFHIQIEGEKGRTERPFPHSVPVPRLPCIAFTPMAVLEFVLGELFQDEWESHTRAQTASVEAWRGIQRGRLERLLTWQQRLIKDNSAPPWTTLKTARPDLKLFCE